MFVAVADQRLQRLHLGAGLEHRLMGAVEVVEVLDQGVDAWTDIEGLEHVLAHEAGQVPHGFH